MARASAISIATLALLLATRTSAANTAVVGDTAVDTSMKRYFTELEALGLLDLETGTAESLRAELGAAEELLRSGAANEAAVALFAIVESPRYAPFVDFEAYQNAEYALAISLMRAGALGSALTYLARVMKRGAQTMYFAPAHRRAVDIALETDYFAGILALLEKQPLTDATAEPAGERAYLRARVAYESGDFARAEAELAKVDERSRLHSSALYLRGVMRARGSDWSGAAAAFCEVAGARTGDAAAFLIDERYYTIKDLARLGLGRIAHEIEDYDDAYYHYFQIPEDSDRLPEALLESAWSMYQSRQLDTARALTEQLLTSFPTSPQMPEGQLLAGYVELADCEFDAAQAQYARVIRELEPIAAELERIRRDPARRARLFDRALARYRAERVDPTQRLNAAAKTPTEAILGLLRLDPSFVRLHETVAGLRRAAGDAPHVIAAWTGLTQRLGTTAVAAVTQEEVSEASEASEANELIGELGSLGQAISRARDDVRRATRAGQLPADQAAAELERLAGLERQRRALQRAAKEHAAGAAEASTLRAAPSLAPLLRADLARARQYADAARRLQRELSRAADAAAKQSLDDLYRQVRAVLDKARLGKIDAVIGQKRALEIEVSDLALGRYPAELTGMLWDESAIADDEEYWPFEGEYWEDEYDRWR